MSFINIPPTLLPIVNYLGKMNRLEDQEFMLRCIRNKEAGFGMRKYEIDRLREFEKDWYDHLPEDAIVTPENPSGLPVEAEVLNSSSTPIESE